MDNLEEISELKQVLDNLKKMVDGCGGTVSLRMKTADGHIVELSVKDDDGSFDNDESGNDEDDDDDEEEEDNGACEKEDDEKEDDGKVKVFIRF